MSYLLEVCQVEFHEGQQTVWVHAPDGTTMLRIKCTGKIKVNEECVSPVAHCDMIVEGDINFCMPKGEV